MRQLSPKGGGGSKAASAAKSGSRKPAPERSSSRGGRGLDSFLGSFWIPLLVFALALAIRLIHLDQVTHATSFPEPRLEESWTHAVASELAAPDRSTTRPFPLDPGASLVLAGLIRLLGDDSHRLGLALAILGALTAVVIQRIGRNALGGASGLIAGLLAAGYRPSVCHGAHLVDAAITPFIMALPLWALAGLRNSSNRWIAAIRTLMGGFGTAILVLFQFPLIVLVPVTMIALAFDRKLSPGEKVAREGAFAAGAFAALVLVSLVQTPAGTPPLLIPPIGGRELHLANRADNRAGFRVPPSFAAADPAGLERDYRAEAARRLGRADITPLESSRFWSGVVLHEGAANPWGFLTGVARRAWLLLSATEAPGPYDFRDESHRSWALRLPFPGWAILGPLAFVGLFAFTARGGVGGGGGGKKSAGGVPAGGVFLVLWFGAILAALLPFAITSRGRLTVEPALIPLAVAGATTLALSIKRRDGKRAAGLLALLLVLSVIARLPIGR